MPSVRANGLEIAYEVDGDGPPLVLLHGATSTGTSEWAGCRAALARSFRLYLPDARGHGRTAWDARAGLRLDDLAADVAAFADALALEAFHLAGFSLGGMTALRTMTRVRGPDDAEDGGVPLLEGRVASVVLVSCDVERMPAARIFRAAADPERIAREDPVRAAELERLHGPVQGQGAWRALVAAIADEVDADPLPAPADLRRVRIPCLVVCGDRDPFVPVDHAVALFRQLPRGQLLVVPGSGHDVAATHPDLLADAIAAFCVGDAVASRGRSFGTR